MRDSGPGDGKQGGVSTKTLPPDTQDVLKVAGRPACSRAEAPAFAESPWRGSRKGTGEAERTLVRDRVRTPRRNDGVWDKENVLAGHAAMEKPG